MKFQIYYPVNPIQINQKFGEIANLQYYLDHGINFKGHNGIDFAAFHGQPVYATHDGLALYEIDGNQGHGIVIRSNDMFEYDGYPNGTYFKTIYWHLCDSKVQPQFRSPIEDYPNGVQVKTGDLIGYADTTGLSTGDHLHFGLKPTLFNEPPGSWYNLAQDNGFMGAIDPTPYFNGLFAGTIFTFTRNLFFGLINNDDVMHLQRRLGVNPTGNFGPLTFKAVIQFQRYHNITGTGFVGPLTRTALNLTS